MQLLITVQKHTCVTDRNYESRITASISFCYVQKLTDNQASCEGCLFHSVFSCSSAENASGNANTSRPLWQSLKCIIITYILRKNTVFYKILQHICIL